jgi:hypothetical protein
LPTNVSRFRLAPERRRGSTSPNWVSRTNEKIFFTNADDALSLSGAYVLASEIAKPVTVAIPGRPAASESRPLPLLRLREGARRRARRLFARQHVKADCVTEPEQEGGNGDAPKAIWGPSSVTENDKAFHQCFRRCMD